jgi:HlyD family secretion protein
MNRKRLRVLVLAGAVVAGLVAWWAWRPRVEDAAVLSGYIEGDPLYLSAPVSGAVARVAVGEGQRAERGALLFAMDASPQTAQTARAAAAVRQAEAQAQDLRQGQRPAELSVYDAQAAAARAQLAEAQADLRRVGALAAKGIYAPARLDQAQAAYRTAQANVAAIERQRQVGTLGGRDGQIEAADAQIGQARGSLAEAASRLDDLTPRAPAAGRIERVFFQPGEWAAANQPVVSLLPDDRIKVRFFVPQGEVARYRPGRRITFSCDGCGPAQQAQIVHVSPRPEFTPPVIYSRKARDRLVFMVEARPERPRALSPGQPVDVQPLAKAPAP